mgnify:FL=1
MSVPGIIIEIHLIGWYDECEMLNHDFGHALQELPATSTPNVYDEETDVSSTESVDTASSKRKAKPKKLSLKTQWEQYEKKNKIVNGTFSVKDDVIKCNLCKNRFKVYRYAVQHHTRSTTHFSAYRNFREKTDIETSMTVDDGVKQPTDSMAKPSVEMAGDPKQRFHQLIEEFGQKAFKHTMPMRALCSCGVELDLMPATGSFMNNARNHRSSKSCKTINANKLSQQSLLGFLSTKNSTKNTGSS